MDSYSKRKYYSLSISTFYFFLRQTLLKIACDECFVFNIEFPYFFMFSALFKEHKISILIASITLTVRKVMTTHF